MRILLAPDKFKGTLDAPSVAAAMARGVRDALPSAAPAVHPLADGGEGTLDCVASSVPGRFDWIEAEDAFGSPARARVFDTGTAAMIAMHETARLPERPSAPASLRASSRGTGIALARALEIGGDREVVVWVGGSASTDGGAGAAQAAGWRLLDARGRDLAPGGGSLRRLARIAPPGRRPPARVIGACDVDLPLLGEEGAARVFGPQKGAGPAEVRVLEEGLEVLAERIRADLGVDVAAARHGGAGGGMGAGLAAFFGASLCDGFARVARDTGLRARLVEADAVVTGEGRVDAGTLRGKVASKVGRLCRDELVDCLVVAGEVSLPVEALPAEAALGVVAVAAVVDECGREPAFGDSPGSVRTTTANLLRRTYPSG